jgi:tetratricopeptide (TPR) repeat protein
MATYKCPTLGDCERANLGELFTRAPGEDLKCPSCSTLLELQSGQRKAQGLDKRAIAAAIAAGIVIIGAAGGFYYKKSKTSSLDASVPTSVAASTPDVVGPVVVPTNASSGAAVPAATDTVSSSVGSSGGIAPTDVDIKQTRREGDTKLTTGDSAGAATASNQAAAKELVKSAIAQMSQGQLDAADKDLSDALARDDKQPLVYYNVAILRLKQGRTDDALKQLEASFLNGFKFFDQMDKDPDLDSIRQDPRFVELEKRYRPAAQ